MAGIWKASKDDYLWTCDKVSSTKFKCSGYDITLKCLKVTLHANGSKGTLFGGNLIKWSAGEQWVKQEKSDQGNQNIVYHKLSNCNVIHIH